MSDNENKNKDLMPEGGSSPPTDQVSQTGAPAVDSETTDTSSAEEENQQAPSTDNDNDESQSQETEGGEKPDGNKKEDKNDLSDQLKEAGKSLTQNIMSLRKLKRTIIKRIP